MQLLASYRNGRWRGKPDCRILQWPQLPYNMLLTLMPAYRRPVVSQGLVWTPADALGSSSSLYQLLSRHWKPAKDFRKLYRSSPAKACFRGGGSLCGGGSSDSEQAQLQLVASPAYFDARNGFSVNPIGTPGDQDRCNACVGFATIAAAQAAVAAVLRKPGNAVQMSVQDLQYDCPSVNSFCSEPIRLPEAMRRISQKQPVREECLRYNAHSINVGALCTYTCSSPGPDPLAGQGTFKSRDVKDAIEAQKHIRRYGGVVSGIHVNMDHFKAFFKQDRKGIYRGSPKGSPLIGHAVMLIGYSNDDEYWIAKNSFGPGFGDGGFFRIAFDAAGVLDPALTFQLFWLPHKPVNFPLPVTRDSSRGECYLYKGQQLDYVSKLSADTGIRIQDILLDNVDPFRSRDPGESLAGVTVRLCKPSPASIQGKQAGVLHAPC